MLDEPQTHCTTLPLPGVFHQLSITFLDLFLNLLAVLPRSMPAAFGSCKGFGASGINFVFFCFFHFADCV
jgi:hypothetical protein